MSTTATGVLMSSERKSVPFQIRCTRSWLDRVEAVAARLELSAAAYIRTVVTRQLEQDEETMPAPPRRGRKPKAD